MAFTRCRTVHSPIGVLALAGDGEYLTNLVLENVAHPPADRGSWLRDAGAFTDAAEQHQEYFAGERTAFELAVRPVGSAF
jgi:methylated-DNA-[protein]-cysteine S-methyltransferase